MMLFISFMVSWFKFIHYDRRIGGDHIHHCGLCFLCHRGRLSMNTMQCQHAQINLKVISLIQISRHAVFALLVRKYVCSGAYCNGTNQNIITDEMLRSPFNCLTSNFITIIYKEYDNQQLWTEFTPLIAVIDFGLYSIIISRLSRMVMWVPFHWLFMGSTSIENSLFYRYFKLIYIIDKLRTTRGPGALV